MKWLTAAALAAGIAWGDTMPISTLVNLPRDVWVIIRTTGGHRFEGMLVDSSDERVIIEGEHRHFIKADRIEAVSTEKQ